MTIRLGIRLNFNIFVSLLFVPFAACTGSRPVQAPVWPSQAAIRDFDFRTVESNPAIRHAEDFGFVVGTADACRDLPSIPNDFDSLRKLGAATYAVLRAEVERQHPGGEENGWAADMLHARLMQRSVARGREAANARGCDAIMPEISARLAAAFAPPDADGASHPR